MCRGRTFEPEETPNKTRSHNTRSRSPKRDPGASILDGGDGKALPNYVASHPAMVTSILGSLRESTGVDVIGILGASGQPTSTKEVK